MRSRVASWTPIMQRRLGFHSWSVLKVPAHFMPHRLLSRNRATRGIALTKRLSAEMAEDRQHATLLSPMEGIPAHAAKVERRVVAYPTFPPYATRNHGPGDRAKAAHSLSRRSGPPCSTFSLSGLQAGTSPICNLTIHHPLSLPPKCAFALGLGVAL